MGTLFTIVLHARDGAAATNAATAAFARIAELERACSDYDEDSELMRLCRAPAGRPVRLSADLFAVLSVALQMAELSEGAFDPTVGPLSQLWRRARRQRALPASERVAEAMSRVGFRKVQLDERARTATLAVEGMQLDLGGVAKGFAADAALGVLRRHGFRRALVAASGDFALGDPPPGRLGWRIGLVTSGGPGGGPDQFVTLSRAAISTSGDAEQFLEVGGVRYSHIVDPRTGLGLTNGIQVSVVAPGAASSDALATALCVLGAERGTRLLARFPETAALFRMAGTGQEKRLVRTGRFPKLTAVKSFGDTHQSSSP
jgi:thiamine biosynthesis lipoprotein